MDATPQPTPHADPPAPTGELVVHNGRLSGTRKALAAAVTFLGRAEGCDVRLSAEGVLPFHCAVVRGPDGLVLRSLPGALTLVNDTPVAEGPLCEGDLLTVGPFQFRVAVFPTAPIDRAALEREKDALRIQAAAVVAQQAALDEEEARLDQRRATLERQEAQLSAHLEERRQKLVELQGQVREARLALRNEREEHEKQVAQTTAELVGVRREVTAEQEKLRDERRRLADLHRRLKRRYGAHWRAAQAEVRSREGELAAERRKLEAERAALNEARLRFNGEAELGRRQLQDGFEQLQRARQQWEVRHGREDADLRRRARELAAGESSLSEQWQRWDETRRGLEIEAEGLESRVRNLRRKAQEQEQEAQRRGLVPVAAAPSEATPPARPRAEPSAAESARVAELVALAGQLADQRLHLREQAARLARVHEQWQAEHAAAVADLDEAARRLLERETGIEPRERAVGEAEAELGRRAAAVTHRQAQLDAWQARLASDTAAWDAERALLLAGVQTREEEARRQAEALGRLRRRWARRRKQEVQAVRAALHRCTAARRQYAALWEECLNHVSALEQQQRALAERALALEQYRLEVIGRAPDSAAAEKRMERLRRRCAAPTAAARRNLDRERQALEAEAKRLQKLSEQLKKQAAGLAARGAGLSRRLAAWEEDRAATEAGRARLEAEVRALTTQRGHQEREAQALRDEVERLARLLMDDGPALLPVAQAA